MSHNSNYKQRLCDTRQGAGPLGLGSLGWIVIGALIGVVILLALGTTQAPMFALGSVGAGLGIILGNSAGRKNPRK